MLNHNTTYQQAVEYPQERLFLTETDINIPVAVFYTDNQTADEGYVREISLEFLVSVLCVILFRINSLMVKV